jgi:hypothetical protein
MAEAGQSVEMQHGRKASRQTNANPSRQTLPDIEGERSESKLVLTASTKGYGNAFTANE